MKEPKVFISYSWTSKEHEEKVSEFAERLMIDGIPVVMDKWDFKEGQDKYKFMEKQVTDPTITNVLIICDHGYVEKANAAKCGVGAEKMIISPKIYEDADQTKFIPIIFENDEDGKPYKPTFCESRKHIDLSNDEVYEENYEELIRSIFNVKKHTKPPLGKPPAYLENKSFSHTELKTIVKKIRNCGTSDSVPVRSLSKDFEAVYVDELFKIKSFKDKIINFESVTNGINNTLPIRNIYFDYLRALLMKNQDLATFITAFLENVFNGILERNHETYQKSFNSIVVDHYRFLFWEITLLSTAFLIYHEMYDQIHTVVKNTYFIKLSSEFSEGSTISVFNGYINMIDDYKTETGSRYYFYRGEILKQREHAPFFRLNDMVTADSVLFILCQIYGGRWFPGMYIYGKQKIDIWTKLKSRKHFDKIKIMFGVDDLESFKELIQKTDFHIMPQPVFRPIPTIQSVISMDEIGTLN